MSIYQFTARLSSGEKQSLSAYEGEVLLIVNTATECGFTPQLRELQSLYDKYKADGFTVLAFPCNQFGNQEPGSNEEVQETCQLNYGVRFPIFEKIKVKGEEQDPLFAYLTEAKKGFATKKIKWNFTKFLIDRQGQVIDRFAPQTKPSKLEEKIKQLLKEPQ